MSGCHCEAGLGEPAERPPDQVVETNHGDGHDADGGCEHMKIAMLGGKADAGSGAGEGVRHRDEAQPEDDIPF